MSLHGDHEHGAAWRRRQRRLRMHWRHEQLTLQMLLATYEHHARSTGTEQGQERGGGHEMYYTAAFRNIPLSQVAGTEYFSLDVEDVPDTGTRPDRLAGVRQHERVQQHFEDQFVDTASALPILGVPVPLMGEQLVDVLQFFDSLRPVAEQVIEVPKIIIERIPPRTLVREPQLAEQLVEVPTIVSFSSLLQRTVRSSTSTFQFLVVEGDSQVFKVLFPDRVQQRLLSSRSLTFLVEIFKVLALDRVRQRLLLFILQLDRMMTRMSLVQGFFALFPG